MDEQHDQAVLQIEEIETDTEYDYLSILREMQHSLNADDEFSASLKTTDDEANLTFEPDLEAVAAPQLETDLPASDNFAAQESDQAADYFADAKTQPLPELPTDFINDLMSGSFERSLETEENSDNSPTASAENSFNSEIVAPETAEMTSFEENHVAVELDDQPFDDFAELSPILFDSNERPQSAEPNFDSELSAATETSPEMATEDLSANLPTNLTANQSEMVMDDLPIMADEMPTNLAFGEMFVEDTLESPAKFAPPIELGEESESEFASLLERFETENSAFASNFQEQPVATADEQNFNEQNPDEQNPNEQNLAINFLTNNGEMPVKNEAADFALPEAMLLGQGESDFAPEPSFALLEGDEHQESVGEMTVEPQMPTEVLHSGDLSLAVPSFLEAELAAAKEPATEESLPGDSFATQNITDTTGNLAPEPKALKSDYFAPSLATENDRNETFEAFDHAVQSSVNGEISFDKYIAADEAEEMPETALFESLATGELPEIDYPEDLSQDFLASSLSDESEGLPENSLEEMPEPLLLLDNSQTEMPEVDLAEPETLPAIKDVDSQVSDPPPTDSAFAAPAQAAVGQSSRQEMSDITKSVSFLKERFVIFKLDDTLYAFPAINVAEIGQLLPITPLPFVPSWFLGISNLRGDILSVVGLRELWEKNTTLPHKSKILIVHSEKQALTIGLVVDAVREMRHVKPEEIFSDDSQNEIESHFASYKIGMVEYEGQNLCLLNAEKLLETLKR
ncbi:MAG: chemotaxis protein CheW [Pyrinomonadaceae bacterium]